jgi:hypothetical protein
MELLLAVAVMAVAVASWIIATTFRIRIRENTTDLVHARKQIDACAEGLQQAEKRLRTQSDHDQSRWADEFETVRQQMGEAQVHLARHDEEIRQHAEQLGDPGTAGDLLGTARSEMQRLQQAVRDLDQRSRQAEEAAAKAQGRYADAADGLAQLRQQAELQLASMARDVSQLARNLNGIEQYVQTRLDDEVAATRGSDAHRVLAGGIHAEQPAAADILPLLYDAFVRELPLDMLFRGLPRQPGSRCYLLWRAGNGESVEQRLDTLLRGCGTDSGTAAPGLTELRGLLLTLYAAGPAALQVGPLVAVRTGDGLIGAVLSGPDAGLLDGQATLPPPEECKKLLTGLDDGQLVDLGSWAESHSS